MTVLSIVSVKDSAVDAFMNPFVVPAVGAAVRSFTDEINRSDAGNAMFKHPGDYFLYELGSFDDATGQVQSLPTPRLLVRGADVVAVNTNPG